MAILANLLDMDFKFVFPDIYINFDTQTNFEVNQTRISHSISKMHSKKSPKWPYLKKSGILGSKNRPWLVCAKSIFTLILNVSDKFIEKCRRSRLFSEWHLETWEKWGFGEFLEYLGE